MERENIEMSDEEFEVLDQLYFVISYTELKDQIDYPDQTLVAVLCKLLSKGWVKCFDGADYEIQPQEENLKVNYAKYQYLASKQGLLAHNSR